MGFYEGLDAEKYDRKYSDKELTNRIWRILKPYRKGLLIIVLCLSVYSFLGASQPVIASKGIDILKRYGSGLVIYIVPLVLFILGGLGWLINWYVRVGSTKIIASLAVKLAQAEFSAAVKHDLSFFDEYSSGRILSRITTDTRSFSELIQVVASSGSMLLESLILGVFLLTVEWRLALLLFAMIPVIFVITIAYRKIARTVTTSGMRATANVNATIKETISGIAVAKNFRQETGIYNEFNEANQLSYRVNVKRGLALAIVFPTLQAIGGTVTAILVYNGGLTVYQGLVTAGTWYLFIASMDRFMYPVMELSSFWTQVQSGLAAAERIFALMDAESSVKQTDSLEVTELCGKIAFKNVNFHYKENEIVLDDFSLLINEGENVAFVGHTGAGKSSIAKLIARFYEFQSGEILIDDKNIRSFNLASYRKKLGIVSQTPFLFSATVVDNIRYANPEATESEILKTAQQIGNGDWLDTLPEGLQTQVGERGGRLSMGQRQLVALMRVLVQRPSIFILDEATASIDPFTEWQIQQALNLILTNTTSILIAHRLSTVRSANRIIVLDKGKIVETGNHQELLDQNGHYAGLYNTYFRHQSLAYIEQSKKLSETEVTQ